MAEKDIDKIPWVDPELQAEREAKRKARRQQEEFPPEPEEEKPKSPTFPTSKPPKKDVPMGGVPTND